MKNLVYKTIHSIVSLLCINSIKDIRAGMELDFSCIQVLAEILKIWEILTWQYSSLEICYSSAANLIINKNKRIV